MEIVRNHQEVARVLDPLRFLLNTSRKLVERVERQKLNPCAPIDLHSRDALLDTLHHAVRPSVSVTHRQSDLAQVLIEQDVVHPPPVDAQTGWPSECTRQRDVALDLAKNSIQIPTLVIGLLAVFRRGAEPAHLAQAPAAIQHLAKHEPPASSAKVDGEASGRFGIIRSTHTPSFV